MTWCSKKSATSLPTRHACLFQLERKVEERESDTLRSVSFRVIRLQESESHTRRRSSIASEQFFCATETHPSHVE